MRSGRVGLLVAAIAVSSASGQVRVTYDPRTLVPGVPTDITMSISIATPSDLGAVFIEFQPPAGLMLSDFEWLNGLEIAANYFTDPSLPAPATALTSTNAVPIGSTPLAIAVFTATADASIAGTMQTLVAFPQDNDNVLLADGDYGEFDILIGRSVTLTIGAATGGGNGNTNSNSSGTNDNGSTGGSGGGGGGGGGTGNVNGSTGQNSNSSSNANGSTSNTNSNASNANSQNANTGSGSANGNGSDVGNENDNVAANSNSAPANDNASAGNVNDNRGSNGNSGGSTNGNTAPPTMRPPICGMGMTAQMLLSLGVLSLTKIHRRRR